MFMYDFPCLTTSVNSSLNEPCRNRAKVIVFDLSRAFRKHFFVGYIIVRVLDDAYFLKSE